MPSYVDGKLRVLSPGIEYPDFHDDRPRREACRCRVAAELLQAAGQRSRRGRRCGTISGATPTTTATARSTSSSASRTGATTAGTTPGTRSGKWTNGPLHGFVYCLPQHRHDGEAAVRRAASSRGRRQAARHLRLPVAELRGLRRRRRSRPALRRVPRRLHLLREHRHAHRAAAMPTGRRVTDADGQAAGDGPGDDRAGRVRLGPRRRPRSDRRRRGRPRGVRREHRQARRRPHAAFSQPRLLPAGGRHAEVRRAGHAGRLRLGRRRRHRHRQRQHGGLHRVLRKPQRPEGRASRSGPRRSDCEADGKTFRIMAGPNGSIQGPAEAKWGYTTLQRRRLGRRRPARHRAQFHLGQGRSGSRTSARAPQPKLAAPQPIEVEWNGAQPAARLGLVQAARARRCSRSGAPRRSSSTSTATAWPTWPCSTTKATSPSSSARSATANSCCSPPRRAFVDETRRAAAAERRTPPAAAAAASSASPIGTATASSTSCSIPPTPTSSSRSASATATWIFKNAGTLAEQEHRRPRRQPRPWSISTATACPISSAARRTAASTFSRIPRAK